MRLDAPGEPWGTVTAIPDPQRTHVELDNANGGWLIVPRALLHVPDRRRGGQRGDAPVAAPDELWGDA